MKCDQCGYLLPAETLPLPAVTPALLPRPSIRSQPPNLQIRTSGRCSQQLDVVMNPSVRITPGGLLLPHNGRLVVTSGGSVCNGFKQAGGKKHQITKPCELNDPSKYFTLLHHKSRYVSVCRNLWCDFKCRP